MGINIASAIHGHHHHHHHHHHLFLISGGQTWNGVAAAVGIEVASASHDPRLHAHLRLRIHPPPFRPHYLSLSSQQGRKHPRRWVSFLMDLLWNDLLFVLIHVLIDSFADSFVDRFMYWWFINWLIDLLIDLIHLLIDLLKNWSIDFIVWILCYWIVGNYFPHFDDKVMRSLPRFRARRLDPAFWELQPFRRKALFFQSLVSSKMEEDESRSLALQNPSLAQVCGDWGVAILLLAESREVSSFKSRLYTQL